MSRKYKILVGLLTFNALSALGGGAGLVTGTLPVPTALLRHTPFDSYVIPGLFLGIAIGGSALVGAIALLAHAKRSRLISAAAAFIMIGWIAGETILVEGFSWLQGLYLLTGVLVVVGAWYLPVSAHIPESEHLPAVAPMVVPATTIVAPPAAAAFSTERRGTRVRSRVLTPVAAARVFPVCCRSWK